MCKDNTVIVSSSKCHGVWVEYILNRQLLRWTANLSHDAYRETNAMRSLLAAFLSEGTYRFQLNSR